MAWITRKVPLLAAALLLLAGGTARAAIVDVRVPFPFVVKGQQFPAGEYRLESDQDTSVVLIRGEKGNTGSAFAFTMPAPGRDPAGDKPALTFKRYENQYRLADIWAAADDGKAIPAASARR